MATTIHTSLNIFNIVFVFLIALEHLYIAYLEIYASPDKQAHIFDMSPGFTKKQPARIAMANQGIYNAMLGVLIILVYFMFKSDPITLIKIWKLLMAFITVVGAFGGFTATKKIFWVQMLPALIALIWISI